MRFARQYPGWCCPYCGKPVGYVGRALAWFFGTRIHDCDGSNAFPDYPEPTNEDV